jgi:SecD/SecF fusion protein
MKRSHLYKFLFIIFVLAWAFYSIYPPESRDILEVFKERASAPKKDEAYTNLLNNVEALRKETPNANSYTLLSRAIRQGTNDVTRYFPEFNVKGEKDPNKAVLSQLQREAAGKIKLGLDLQGGTSFLVEMDTNKLIRATEKDSALANAVEVLRKRVDKLGVAEPVIQPAGSDRILIQLPGLSEADKESARRQIEKAAFLEFRMVHPNSDELLAQGIVEPGYEVLRQTIKQQDGSKAVASYLVNKKPERGLTGKNIKRAGVSRQQLSNEPEIDFELDSEGAKIFADITREYSPKGNKYYHLAIVLDGELSSAPRIMGEIPGGRGQITGNFDAKEAYELAYSLENPLEAPVRVIYENTVAPSLGADTIRSGWHSAVYGTIAVAAFMAIYYMVAGLVANVALLVNIIILLGVMCSLGTTLTLPGIAGIVLTVGMAVDANVLIFERIREEQAKGKTLRGALAAGYSRAFGTIFDSHVTTLISSIILIFMGTGSVKGFGVALTIGVAASLFTALVVTRLIFDFLLAKNMMKSMPMLHFIRATKLNFMKLAKPAFILSWLVIIIGIGYGIHRGKDAMSIDFVGGDSVTLAFDKRVSEDQLRAPISDLHVGDVMIQYQQDISSGKETLHVTSRSLDIDKKNGASPVDRIKDALTKAFPDAKFHEISRDQVGATVGKEIQKTAIIASLLSLFGILCYVAVRYEFSFAVGAVVAIIHDVLMTLGWYFLSGREMNAAMMAAVLTIIGFSINDTIVIFDRIREDLKLGVRGSFRDLINQALNQTLSRTIITAGTVFLATLSLYLFGGAGINDFAFAFLVGIITGTYSSIYIASALVLWWHKGERPKIGVGAAPANVDSAPPMKSAARA